LIEQVTLELTEFDSYIVPQKFFGPGEPSAYVGMNTATLEDPANVEFNIVTSKNYVGFLRKQPRPEVSTLLQHQVE
jgi:hypothetical protein